MSDPEAARALGAAVRRFRVDRGLTQQQVAVKLGMSRSHYSNVESGRGLVSLVRLRALCRVLDVALDDLVDAAWPDESGSREGEYLESVRAWAFGKHSVVLGTLPDDHRTALVRCSCEPRPLWTRRIGVGLLSGRAITTDANLVIAIAAHIAGEQPGAAHRLHSEGFLSALGNHQDVIAVLDAVADNVHPDT